MGYGRGVGLEGRAVVVTRAVDQAGALVRLLLQRGAKVVELPCIGLRPPASWDALDAAVADLGAWDWVVLTSLNGAKAFGARVGAVPQTVELACVGAKTAAWVRERFAVEPLVPPSFRGDALADAIVAHGGGGLVGRRVLLPQAEEAKDDLRRRLEAAGADVRAVTAYRSCVADPPDPATAARAAAADAVTFMSGKTLRAFMEIVPDAAAILERAVVAVVGPVAAAEAAAAGVRVDVVPGQATAEAMVEALDAHLDR